MANDTRQRMIESTAALLRSKGLAGTSFSDITSRAQVPRGVIYHHFPDGKVELALAAVEWTGAGIRAHLDALEGDTPMDVVDAYLSAIRGVVAESANGSSCAIAAVTVESSSADDPLAKCADRELRALVATLAARLTERGTAHDAALDVATMLLVLLQGSHVMCRAAGDLDAFDRAARLVRIAAAGIVDT